MKCTSALLSSTIYAVNILPEFVQSHTLSGCRWCFFLCVMCSLCTHLHREELPLVTLHSICKNKSRTCYFHCRIRNRIPKTYCNFYYQYHIIFTLYVLGREEGYTVKYTPSPSGVPSGFALGNSFRVYLTIYPSSRPNTDTVYCTILFILLTVLYTVLYPTLYTNRKVVG